MRFVEALRPEHLQAFWWFASPKSLAYIRTYGGLLSATSATDEEADFYRQKLEDFRWSLKVRAKGVGFVSTALREMVDSLEDLDMSRSPVGRTIGRPGYAQGPITVDNEGMFPHGLGINTTTDGDGAFGGGHNDAQYALLQTTATPDFSLLDLDAASSQAFFADLGSHSLFYSPTPQS
jgi:hypothetical protein